MDKQNIRDESLRLMEWLREVHDIFMASLKVPPEMRGENAFDEADFKLFDSAYVRAMMLCSIDYKWFVKKYGYMRLMAPSEIVRELISMETAEAN